MNNEMMSIDDLTLEQVRRALEILEPKRGSSAGVDRMLAALTACWVMLGGAVTFTVIEGV